eukprot:1159163-Pelagomonas_calceolata.AAC.10
MPPTKSASAGFWKQQCVPQQAGRAGAQLALPNRQNWKRALAMSSEHKGLIQAYVQQRPNEHEGSMQAYVQQRPNVY